MAIIHLALNTWLLSSLGPNIILKGGFKENHSLEPLDSSTLIPLLVSCALEPVFVQASVSCLVLLKALDSEEGIPLFFRTLGKSGIDPSA